MSRREEIVRRIVTLRERRKAFLLRATIAEGVMAACALVNLAYWLLIK